MLELLRATWDNCWLAVGWILTLWNQVSSMLLLRAPFYRRVYCATAEQAVLEDMYGAIVFGDVLEHLADPAAVLSRLMSHLSPDGVVLVSLPSIAHLAIRLMLLGGKFPAMDRGALDRTHLHFYTRSSAEQLVQNAGLRVIEWLASLVPLLDLATGRLN